jgi:hypothetical protein
VVVSHPFARPPHGPRPIRGDPGKANGWGTGLLWRVWLRFIPAVTRVANRAAQNDRLYFVMNFRDRTLEKFIACGESADPLIHLYRVIAARDCAAFRGGNCRVLGFGESYLHVEGTPYWATVAV